MKIRAIIQQTVVFWKTHSFGAMILSITGSQIGTSAITSVIGFAYWWAAAKFFAPRIVGTAAATISTMQLFGSFGVLGLGTFLMSELSKNRANQENTDSHQQQELVITALSVAGIAGTLLGLGGAYIVPLFTPALSILSSNILIAGFFAIGVGFTSITVVVDSLLLGMLRGGLQVWRNAIFVVAKLSFLVITGLFFAKGGAMLVYLTWFAGSVISIAILGVIMLRDYPDVAHIRPRWKLLQGKISHAMEHHILNVALGAPTMAMPLVVAAVLTPSSVAYFYTSSMIAGFLYMIPFSLTISLFAVGAAHGTELSQKVRFTLHLAAGIGLLLSISLLFAAPIALNFFGPKYLDHAVTSLRILGFAVFPLIVKDHFIAITRIRETVRKTIPFIISGTALELLVAGLGGHIAGLSGVSIGWITALCIEAFCMLPYVLKVYFWHEPYEELLFTVLDVEKTF